MTIHYEHTIGVSTTAQRAFAVLDDFSQTPTWLDRCTHIETLTVGSHAVGTKLRYGYREGKRTGTMDGVVTARTVNERLAMRYTDSMMDVAVAFRIDVEGEGVRLTQTIEITPKSFVVKLAAPIIRRQLPGQTAVAMQRLKALLERVA